MKKLKTMVYKWLKVYGWELEDLKKEIKEIKKRLHKLEEGDRLWKEYFKDLPKKEESR